jgi:predicted N-acetyltransferase YhbS
VSRLPLRIVSLSEQRALLSALAQLHHEEWSEISSFKTVAEHEKKLLSRISQHPPPETYVLILEGEVAGSVSLLEHDDIADVRPDLSPWLASLLVVPKHRGRGYGRELAAFCADQARTLGYAMLYLYTHTHPDYYAQLGWHFVERRTVRGDEVTVMQTRLLTRTTEQVS